MWNKLIVCIFFIYSALTQLIWTYYTSNESKELEIYDLMNLENDFFHFYFSNSDFLFIIDSLCTKLFVVIKNSYIQGILSQNFNLGFCYFFMM